MLEDLLHGSFLLSRSDRNIVELERFSNVFCNAADDWREYYITGIVGDVGNAGGKSEACGNPNESEKAGFDWYPIHGCTPFAVSVPKRNN